MTHEPDGNLFHRLCLHLRRHAVGLFLRNILPEHHLSEESKDAVTLGIGMIATLAALGLLVASAKGTFDRL